MALQTTTCCGCHAQVPADNTFFSAIGEVCPGCHSRQAASDSARFAAGADGNATFDAMMASDGGFNFYIGPINVVPVVRGIFGLFARIVRSFTGRS